MWTGFHTNAYPCKLSFISSKLALFGRVTRVLPLDIEGTMRPLNVRLCDFLMADSTIFAASACCRGMQFFVLSFCSRLGSAAEKEEGGFADEHELPRVAWSF